MLDKASELLEFEKAGTLEAFNSDGLRSLIYTLNNNMYKFNYIFTINIYKGVGL